MQATMQFNNESRPSTEIEPDWKEHSGKSNSSSSDNTTSTAPIYELKDDHDDYFSCHCCEDDDCSVSTTGDDPNLVARRSLSEGCDSTNCDMDGRSKSVKSLQFGTIEYREYTIILGDNPCCRSGPPIGLGWEYRPRGPYDVSAVERRKLDVGRRSGDDLIIPDYKRRNLLRSCGFTDNEIFERIQDIDVFRKKNSSSKLTKWFKGKFRFSSY